MICRAMAGDGLRGFQVIRNSLKGGFSGERYRVDGREGRYSFFSLL